MSSIPTPSCLSTLPPELLTSVLSHLFTKDLVHASSVNHAIHDCADYLLRQRIRHIPELDGHAMVIECSPPSNRFTAPYHPCKHTSTHPSTATLTANTPTPTLPIPAGTSPSSVFSHFTPHPQTRTDVVLEAGEFFTQLCASSFLAKVASVRPVFSETFFRVRRSWLLEGVKCAEGRMVWLDERGNLGLRLKVEGEAAAGEEEEVQFGVVVEEVVVRSGYLVEVVEGVF
ncbi:uncharacterized protein H6S33_006805 [Morchella sextelata]|uniref:uncharacterized protein n=1 Tax=Morchella sextelata TaxID=1174677 RepID=UPI001D0550BF|nr:uncharacterized protein H6S33_006805 [Morchella sextelata]KAH0604428.1 hypothetical protein H6S33_006805 [Morchella sextelata]